MKKYIKRLLKKFNLTSINIGNAPKKNNYNKNQPKEIISWPAYKPTITPSINSKFKKKIKIACILDVFSFECFKYEADLLPLSLHNWHNELCDEKVDFVFIESIWRGNDDQWRIHNHTIGEKLKRLVNFCKLQGIKTVFWNKEDPLNFENYIHFAKEFDYIFTTDENMISEYRKYVQHDHIYPLPFAAQPVIHNPIRNKKLETYDVCFAGTWFSQKHDKRREFLKIILDATLNEGLHIYDRMSNINSDKYTYPETYQPAIVGSLDYQQMLTAYRQYRIFLNVNSVVDSPTMLSRRVFELLACATPVITTPSLAISKILKDVIFVVDSEHKTQQYIKMLLSNELYYNKFAHLCYRKIHSEHTYQKRLQMIISKIDPRVQYQQLEPLVTLVCSTNKPANINHVFQNYENQVYPNKELIIVLNNDEYEIEKIKEKSKNFSNIRIFQIPENQTLSTCLNFAFNEAKGEYLSKIDDDDYYGPYFISDSLLALNYSNADIVGKQTYFTYIVSEDMLAIRFIGHENTYTRFIHGGTMVMKRKVFDAVKFIDQPSGADTLFLRESIEKGFIIFSADPYNFIYRREADTTKHSWKISLDKFLEKTKFVCKGLNLDLVHI